MENIKNYFCPNKQCKCYGLRSQGNIVKAGKYIVKGIERQMLKCNVCKTRFSETRNTIFFGSHYTEEQIYNIIRCISEGNGVRATARLLALDKNAVGNVVLKAGNYAETIMRNLLKNLCLNECQMDELWSFVNKKNAGRKRD
jgi:transposase-like protein